VVDEDLADVDELRRALPEDVDPQELASSDRDEGVVGHAISPGRRLMAVVAREWFIWTGIVVGGRVAYLIWLHGFRLALVWLVKLVTDPVTDLIAYSPRYLGRA
jgi:hypothetical protein